MWSIGRWWDRGRGQPRGAERGTERAYDVLPVPILRVDAALQGAYANEAWRSLTGPVLNTIGGYSWLEAFHPEEWSRVLLALRAVLEDRDETSVEVRAEGSERWFRLRASPASGPDSPGVVVVGLESTEDRRREAELQFRAMHDGLTGVYNRLALLDHARMALGRLDRSRGLVAVLFIDLDGFKDVNDRFGHVIGDTVLAVVAQRFQGAVRGSDVLGRIGGDEFVVVCEGLHHAEEAGAVARRVVGMLDQPIHASGTVTVRTSASVGVALADGPAESAEAVIERADRALHEAKRSRTRIRLHPVSEEERSGLDEETSDVV